MTLQLLGEKRLLLIFAPSAGEDRLLWQLKHLRDRRDSAAERDLDVIQIYPDSGVDHEGCALDQDTAREFRSRFNVGPDDAFQVLLLDRGGEELLRADDVEPAQAFFERLDARTDAGELHEAQRQGV